VPDNNTPVKLTYGTGLRVLSAVKRIEGLGRGEAPIAKRPRHIGQNGGGRSATSLTAFAVVTVTAAANCDGAGKCVLLKDDKPGLSPVDKDGEPLVLDELDPDYDADKVHGVEVTFYSAHFDAACNKGERVRLFSARKIQPDDDAPATTDDDPLDTIFGLNVDGSGYWQGHATFANNRYLGATLGESLYRDFETATVNLAGSGTCVDGSIVITIDSDGTTYVVPPS
jgi:hypothetical protein